MKIGITCYPTYGGSGVVATELGKQLALLGHEIHFISYAMPYRLNNFTENIYYHEVDVLRYPLFEYPPYSLSLASKMAEIIEYQKLDFMHVHYAIPHAASAYLAKKILKDDSFKIITTLHGTDITLLGSDPSFFKITKFSIEESNGITAVSKYLKLETENVFSIIKPIEVIPNFIPFGKFLQSASQRLRNCYVKKDETIITHISNFRPLKRVMDIVPIIKKVLQKANVKVLMVGDGPERYKTEEQCRHEGLCDKVHFLGKQENVEEILDITDIFLLPSESESFGLAALEAMAIGVPCVTSNAGGLPEVNINGETGFTLNVGDISGFADAITRIIQDKQLAAKMCENSKRISWERFSADKVVEQYLNYYRKILSAE